MPIEVDTKNLVEQNMMMGVTLKCFNQWQFRLRLASLLARLAAWIAWVGIEFESVEDSERSPSMHWHRNFSEQQLTEIALSRDRVRNHKQDEDCDILRFIIANLSDLMDLQEIQQQEWPKSDVDSHSLVN
jgi:hypothetical protein